jgi:phage shock protein C
MWPILRLGGYILSSFAVWQAAHGFLQQVPIAIIQKKLSLDPLYSLFLGVCAGISNYSGIDVTIIRLLWLLACLYRGLRLIAYLLAFFTMPAL